MFRAPYTYLNKTPRIWQERTTQLVKKETRSKDSAGDTNMCQKHCWLMSCFDWCGGHWLLQLQYTFLKVPDESIPIQVLVSARDVYCYQNSKQYISSIHCFDTRYVSSILISSKYQDKQVAVLMTGPPKPRSIMCTTLKDSRLAQNGTQSQFGVEWVAFFGQKH